MKKLAVVLTVMLLLGSTVAACWLVNVWHKSKEQEVKIVELRKLASREPVTNMKGRLEPVTKPSTASQSDGKSHGEPILHDFAVLNERNSDCLGWVSIPGTSIDFPVMQDGDFYLKGGLNYELDCIHRRQRWHDVQPPQTISGPGGAAKDFVHDHWLYSLDERV